MNDPLLETAGDLMLFGAFSEEITPIVSFFMNMIEYTLKISVNITDKINISTLG